MYRFGPLRNGLAKRYGWDDKTLTISLSGSTAPVFHEERGKDNLEAMSDHELEAWRNQKVTVEERPDITVCLDGAAQDLKDAFVAIEDKDFYTHKGVYWKRTFGAALAWITGDDDSYGGSTITQQLIKNTKGEKEFSVKRKLNEIFRALELEKRSMIKTVSLSCI